MSESHEIDVRPLQGPLGAEVFGADPAQELAPEAFASIAAALHRHHLLLFRGVIRANERLVGFARRFGEVFRFYEEGTEPGFPEILRISNLEENGKPIGLTGTMELPWHSDYANQPRPAKESFLEAVEVPGNGAAATSFVDMYAAWETLPAALRGAIDGRLALHRPKADYDLDDSTSASTQAQRNAIQTAHPIAVRHPETDRIALYVSPVETTEIIGASDEESQEIFERIFEHVIRPENVYRHDWMPGDLIVFDAIGTMHHREAFSFGQRRFMKQLSTRCEQPPRPA
jgi:taurine dioxygenase